MTKQALKLCEMSWDIVCLCTSCSTCDVISQQRPGSIFRRYVGAVSKRFVNVNNHYFECFQALAFDNLGQSKCHLCNNDIKVSFLNQWTFSLKTEIGEHGNSHDKSIKKTSISKSQKDITGTISGHLRYISVLQQCFLMKYLEKLVTYKQKLE